MREGQTGSALAERLDNAQQAGCNESEIKAAEPGEVSSETSF